MPLQIVVSDPFSRVTKKFEFTSSPVQIGRSEANDVVIAHKFVSDRHAIIRFDDVTISITDLGSTNGTDVRGKKVPRDTVVALENVTPVSIGPISLVVCFPP